MANEIFIIPEILEPGTPTFEATATTKTGTRRTTASNSAALMKWISEQLDDPDVHGMTVERCPDDYKVRNWRLG